MFRSNSLFLGLVFALVLGAPADAVELVNVDFDGMSVDAPVPTGGANQPTSVSTAIEAHVRSGPFPTPCMEIRDNHESTAGWVRFDFVESEIIDGIVTMEFDLWIPTGIDNSVGVYVREPRFAAQSFTTMNFSPSGTIHLNDTSSAGAIGTFSFDESFPVQLIYDMDLGTYDVRVAGETLIDDREHGIVDRGVGGLLFVNSHDAGLDGAFYVDNIVIEAVGSTPVDTATWSEVKSTF